MWTEEEEGMWTEEEEGMWTDEVDHHWMPPSSSSIFLLQCLSLLLPKQASKCSLTTDILHLILLLSHDVQKILLHGWINFNTLLL